MENLQKPAIENMERVKKDISSNSVNAGVSLPNGKPVFINLPYGASDIFVTGIQEVKRTDRTHREYIFEFITEKYGVFSIDSYELASMGFSIQYFSPCNVMIKNSEFSYRALCSPNPYQQPKQQSEKIETESLFTSL